MNKARDIQVEEIIENTMLLKRVMMEKCGVSLDGSTMLQYATLNFIADNYDSKMKDIAEHLSISMSSATQLIDRMINLELVERFVDQNDRRIVIISITKNGKELVHQRKLDIKNKFVEALGALTQDEIEEYLRIQRKMISGLSNINNH